MIRNWWKEKVMYQIYPRSFFDTSGDGIGDINGIIKKADYLKYLGVDLVWLGPVYDSPNDDNGYDIRDYYKIHEEFGNMAAIENLIEEFHSRNIKLIMDLVVNHTSDEHNWFQESKKSIDNPYRDFYYWRKGVNGGPPNNWLSFFGGSAWEHDETTDMYYLHLFTKKQPDLNWENPLVREKVEEILKFWLDKGIDGFRMDVIPLISKRIPFEDAVFSNFNELIEKYYSNGPRVHEFIQQINKNVLSHYDVVTVGEGPGITTETAAKYISPERNELNMIFQLEHMYLSSGEKGKFDLVPYNLKDLKDILMTWDKALENKGWNNIFLDNHDFARLVSRWGNDKEYRVESAKLFALLLLTFRGTPCIYQGSEIGMTNVEFPDISHYNDVETINFYKEFVLEGDMKEEDFMQAVYKEGRDNVRTPIQWNNKRNAGFTSGSPWLEINSNYKYINVEDAINDPNSIFHFYKQLIEFRKSNEVLVYGDLEEITTDNHDLFIYKRSLKKSTSTTILNMSNTSSEISMELMKDQKIEFHNYATIQVNKDVITLRPWEAILSTNI